MKIYTDIVSSETLREKISFLLPPEIAHYTGVLCTTKVIQKSDCKMSYTILIASSFADCLYTLVTELFIYLFFFFANVAYSNPNVETFTNYFYLPYEDYFFSN